MTFKPGHKIQPTSEQLRRGNKTAVALRASLPPERLVAELEEILAGAKQRRAWKVALQTIELWASYAIGKPAQTVEVRNDATDLLARIMQDSGPLLPADIGLRIIEPEQERLTGDTIDAEFIAYENLNSQKLDGGRTGEGEGADGADTGENGGRGE
jgi:hypothetical protein